MRIASSLFGCLVALSIGLAPALAYERPHYLSSNAIDLTVILPPPPRPASKAEEDDVAAVAAIQREASPERAAQAIADDEATVRRFAGSVLGPRFTEENAPKTFALLRRVSEEGNAISELAKQKWDRPRPFLVSKQVRSLVAQPTNASYPSGHTTFAYEMAILLGSMIPDKRDVLFERAADFARSRIITGVHFPTDIAAGRSAGTSIAALLLQSESFMKDFVEAKAELRRVLID
jgi:acid phosphatase (class A)